MIGITSYGAYIPRLRLDRKAIFKNIGWFNPGIISAAQGERSLCNWDEDSVTMAVGAAMNSLKGLNKQNIEGCYLASTTLPFADRQNAGIMATALSLGEGLVTSDFTSSQSAGTTALITALDGIRGGKKSILVAASDKRLAKPASMQEMYFGDGAAALTVGDEEVIAEFKGAYSVSYDFVDHYRGSSRQFDYGWEERWIRDEGYSKIIPEAVTGLLKKLGLTMGEIDRMIYPCYFKAIHMKLAKSLGAKPDALVDNMHEICGETGTAHPLLMLASVLENAAPGQKIIVAGFGQGCDALCFEVTDKIGQFKPVSSIGETIEEKLTTDNYTQFLSFQGLLDLDLGIRAEANTQTALTTLWRNRKMILGLIGGKCRDCGTPQFPKQDICVKPECNHVHSQDDYSFTHIPAKVKTFTGDMLAASPSPPTIYGLVQFEGGGRMLSEFTDCDMQDMKVGNPVKMSFRRRLMDKGRGFSGYFWKAVPQGNGAN
ncbi:hydroxymethylglutaryl-CoA synthase family protein [Thermodesulfobacteriota bacterium]